MMNVEKIKQLHADIEKCVPVHAELFLELKDLDKAREAIVTRCENIRSDWKTKVVAIGEALEEAKSNFGKGWKTDFHTHGFDFTYQTARRFMACAKRPEADAGSGSIAKWARAAANVDREEDQAAQDKEMKRIEQLRKRKAKDVSSRSSAIEKVAESDVDPTDGSLSSTESLTVSDSENQLRSAIAFLHQAITTNSRYLEIRDSWCILFPALSGHLPRWRMVSSSEDGDTVNAGGHGQIADENEHSFVSAGDVT